MPKIISQKEQLSRIRERQEELKDFIKVEDQGLTTYTNTGTLSPGCRACKAGRWVCLYAGRRCNADCFFCGIPYKDRRSWPVIPNKVGRGKPFLNEDIAKMIVFYKSHIDGFSFSGGETSLYYDQILDIFSYIADYAPELYLWLYTNGSNWTEEQLQKMSEVAHEIRFNLAAFDFDERVIERLKIATGLFTRTAVEVPMTQRFYDWLVKEENIYRLVDFGVNQINSAELVLDQEVAFREYSNEEQYEFECFFSKDVSPTNSRLLTYDLIQFVGDHDLSILINDCSQQTKFLQQIKMRENQIADMIHQADR